MREVNEMSFFLNGYCLESPLEERTYTGMA